MGLEQIETAITSLRDEVSLLVQGLRQMLAMQEIHTELLRAIGAAATAPADGEDALKDVLAKVVASLKDQSETLITIRDGIKLLPADMRAALSNHGRRDE